MPLRFFLLALIGCGCSVSAATITIGAPFNRPPYILEDTNSGLELDIIRAAFDVEGLEVDFKYYSRKRQQLFFAREKVDAAMTVNELSGLDGAWSDEYIQYQNVAISLAAKKLNLTSLADLGNYSVASFENAGTTLGPDFMRAVENTIYREVSPQVGLNKMLYLNRIDIVVADRYVFRQLNRQIIENIDWQQALAEHAIIPVSGYKLVFHNSVARDRFNQGLAVIRRNGTYQALVDKYLKKAL